MTSTETKAVASASASSEEEKATPTTKLGAFADKMEKEKKISPFQAAVLRALIKEGDAQLLLAEESHPEPDQEAELLNAVQTAMIEKLEQLWDDAFAMYSTSDGKKISKNERATMNISKSSLVYGEVTFQSLARIVWTGMPPLPPGAVFYDLGSGTGRGVIGAALVHDFSRLTGVEILNGLYEASIDVLKKYDKEVRPKLVAECQKQEIKFVRGSFLDYDWSDGDFVFANSTCFDEDLIAEIATLAEKLKPGAIVITLTKRMHNDAFKLLSSKQYTMSWGYASIHVHQRIDPKAPKEPTASS